MLKCHKQCCNIHYSSFANLAHQSGKALFGKKPFLLISEILRPFFNTLTANGKYFADNRDNLRQLIQMNSSEMIGCEIRDYANVQRVIFQYTLGLSTC